MARSNFHQLWDAAISDDIIRLLRAGGTVICLNYFTFINSGSLLYGSTLLNNINAKRQSSYFYEHKFIGQEETSYEWLDLGFLLATKLDRLNVSPGNNFKVISKLEQVNKYFSYVTEYHKVVEGITRNEGSISQGGIYSSFRTNPSYEYTQTTNDYVDILAVSSITEDPIAVAIKYRGFPGTLVFLPTYHVPPPSPDTKDLAAYYLEIGRSIFSPLCELGLHYYEISQRELGVKLESPPWLLQCRTKMAIEADKELELVEKRKTELISKRDQYDRMLSLINGYGDALQESVLDLFGKQWFGFDVERTERGHPIDLYVKHAEKILAVQVTGIAGKFTQSDKHFGAIMSYLPMNEERNSGGRIERIVLVVNTYRDSPLENRTDKEDISPHVRKLIERNGICLIKSTDLYNLWNLHIESPENLSANDIFNQLFDCEGIWQQK